MSGVYFRRPAILLVILPLSSISSHMTYSKSLTRLTCIRQVLSKSDQSSISTTTGHSPYNGSLKRIPITISLILYKRPVSTITPVSIQTLRRASSASVSLHSVKAAKPITLILSKWTLMFLNIHHRRIRSRRHPITITKICFTQTLPHYIHRRAVDKCLTTSVCNSRHISRYNYCSFGCVPPIGEAQHTIITHATL